MKLQFEEQGSVDYNRYKFPYCVYAIKEETDRYHQFYKNGFLPYTNDLEENREIYYLARSVRISLPDHTVRSKQKNILNKLSKIYEEEKIEFNLLTKEDRIEDPAFNAWSLKNAKNGFLSPERLSYIVSRPYLKQILKITYEEKTLAYLYIITEKKDFIHVWYSFYDLRIPHNDFGKWIFLKTIKWAKKQGYSYFYLGTCYSKSAIYKLLLSPATSFFNGKAWDNETSVLKKTLLKENK